MGKSKKAAPRKALKLSMKVDEQKKLRSKDVEEASAKKPAKKRGKKSKVEKVNIL